MSDFLDMADFTEAKTQPVLPPDNRELISFTQQEVADRGLNYGHFEVQAKALKLNKETGPWLCGGAVRRLFDGTPGEHDWDLFFLDEKTLKAWVQKVQPEKLFETNFAISYEIPYRKERLKVQAIKFYAGSLKEAIQKFDFTCCQFGYDGEKFYTFASSLLDALRKKIVISNITFGVVTMMHLQKYIRQGYSICAGAAADLLQRVAADPSVIRADVKYID